MIHIPGALGWSAQLNAGGGCGSGREKEERRRPLASGNQPAATRASRKPRSQPSASSCRMPSRNRAAAAVTPFSSSSGLSPSPLAKTRSRQRVREGTRSAGRETTAPRPRRQREGCGRRAAPGAARRCRPRTVGQPVRHVAQDVDGVQAPLDVPPVALQAPLLLRGHGKGGFAPPPKRHRSRSRSPSPSRLRLRAGRRRRGTRPLP